MRTGECVSQGLTVVADDLAISARMSGVEVADLTEPGQSPVLAVGSIDGAVQFVGRQPVGVGEGVLDDVDHFVDGQPVLDQHSVGGVPELAAPVFADSIDMRRDYLDELVDLMQRDEDVRTFGPDVPGSPSSWGIAA